MNNDMKQQIALLKSFNKNAKNSIGFYIGYYNINNDTNKKPIYKEYVRSKVERGTNNLVITIFDDNFGKLSNIVIEPESIDIERSTPTKLRTKPYNKYNPFSFSWTKLGNYTMFEVEM